MQGINGRLDTRVIEGRPHGVAVVQINTGGRAPEQFEARACQLAQPCVSLSNLYYYLNHSQCARLCCVVFFSAGNPTIEAWGIADQSAHIRHGYVPFSMGIFSIVIVAHHLALRKGPTDEGFIFSSGLRDEFQDW
jgi:hypothetical protein